MLLLLVLLLLSSAVNAQPISDQTLNTKVTPDGNTYNIEGGATAGTNLFHSFESFSVPQGTQVIFKNDPGITDIFARVGGNLISNIDGIVGTINPANLYLLNPNGVNFGTNAAININGSFLVTTAENINFADGGQFGTQSLLTVSVPIGLQFGNKSSSINNQGRLFNFAGAIALIGNEINLTGGTILSGMSANPSKVELGSVGTNSYVGFDNWNFLYDSVENFGDINLTSSFNPADLPSILIGSNIEIVGQNILIQDGKQVTASKQLNINSESLTIRGTGASPQRGVSASSGLISATFSDADGGNIKINSDRVTLTDQAVISSEVIFLVNPETGEKVFATGNGGNINIQADSVEISDRAKIFASSVGFGSAGNIEVESDQLSVSTGGAISVSAQGLGRGTAGNLKIISNNIVLEQGALSAQSNFGNKGNITINSDTLSIDQSTIATDATAQATGGNITLNSEAIALLNEGSITAQAVEGRGGNINITTSGLIQEPGTNINASSERNIDGEIIIKSPDVDPTSGLIQLPENTIEPEAILAQNICQLENGKLAKGSSFTITGRGGLTPTSEDSLNNIDNVVGWASKDGIVQVRERKNPPVIRQAQRLVRAKDGSIFLIPNCQK